MKPGPSKRNRSSNYTAEEEDILLTLVENNKKIIENKKTDSVSWTEKQKCWEKIRDEFCSQSTIYRTAKQLKEKYENLKRKSKQLLAAEKHKTYKTGGGQKVVAATNNFTERVVALIGTSAVGLENKWESDAVTSLANTKDESGEEVSFQESEGDIQVDHSSCSKDGILEEQRNFFQEENIRARESHELKMEILKLKKEKLALEIENLKKDIVYKNLLIENPKINT